MEIARCIVEGALKNILRVLKYYQSRNKDVAMSIANIKNSYLTLKTATIPYL